MKKAFRFDSVYEREELSNAFPKGYFAFVPDGRKDSRGYLFHFDDSNKGYYWTSGAPDADAQVVYFNEYKKHIPSEKVMGVEDQIKLAKSLIGKRVGYKGKVEFTVNKIKVLIEQREAELSSYEVSQFCAKHGFVVIVSDGTFSLPADSVSVIESVIVKLNNKYTAVVEKDKIKVDCQYFPISVIDELVNARDSLK